MEPVRLLIADLSMNPELYRPFDHWTADANLSAMVFRPQDFQEPPGFGEFTHVILTGSEASICGDDPWIEEVGSFVRACAERNIPLLGSCFGHQLLARALCGRAFVRPSPSPEFGWLPLRLTTEGARDPLLQGIPNPAMVFSAHFDEMAPLPRDWKVLGSSAACHNAIVRWGERPVWGLQHHPEIGIKEGRRLLSGLEAVLDPHRGLLLRENLFEDPEDSLITPKLLKNFLSQVQESA